MPEKEERVRSLMVHVGPVHILIGAARELFYIDDPSTPGEDASSIRHFPLFMVGFAQDDLANSIEVWVPFVTVLFAWAR